MSPRNSHDPARSYLKMMTPHSGGTTTLPPNSTRRPALGPSNGWTLPGLVAGAGAHRHDSASWGLLLGGLLPGMNEMPDPSSSLRLDTAGRPTRSCTDGNSCVGVLFCEPGPRLRVEPARRSDARAVSHSRFGVPNDAAEIGGMRRRVKDGAAWPCAGTAAVNRFVHAPYTILGRQ